MTTYNAYYTFRFLHYETARFLHDITNNPEIGLDGMRILKSIARYTYSAFAMQTFGMDVRVPYPVQIRLPCMSRRLGSYTNTDRFTGVGTKFE
jgi:hypothetical protein